MYGDHISRIRTSNAVLNMYVNLMVCSYSQFLRLSEITILHANRNVQTGNPLSIIIRTATRIAKQHKCSIRLVNLNIPNAMLRGLMQLNVLYLIKIKWF